MKKINVAVTFVIAVLSAIPLMAQTSSIRVYKSQLPATDISFTPEITPLSEKTVQQIKQDITRQAKQQQQSDAIIANKYKTLTTDYTNFVNLMKDKTLVNKTNEVVGQTIWMAIDDLARAILDLPQPARNAYTHIIASDTTYRFAYQHNKKVSL